MKYLITFLFAAILSLQYVFAQTDYCGLTYYYDNVGNRKQRIVTTDCPSGGGGDGRMLVVTDTTTNSLTEALYPNPTAGPVSVVFNGPLTGAQITITDNLGHQLYSATTSGTTIPLDISCFADGLYYIVVRAQGNSWQNTVVKQ